MLSLRHGSVVPPSGSPGGAKNPGRWYLYPPGQGPIHLMPFCRWGLPWPLSIKYDCTSTCFSLFLLLSFFFLEIINSWHMSLCLLLSASSYCKADSMRARILFLTVLTQAWHLVGTQSPFAERTNESHFPALGHMCTHHWQRGKGQLWLAWTSHDWPLELSALLPKIKEERIATG